MNCPDQQSFPDNRLSIEREISWLVPEVNLKPQFRRALFLKFLLGVYGLTSFIVPMILLFKYRRYAMENGIELETGCHGPELFFGMLTGIFLCLFLRFEYQPFLKKEAALFALLIKMSTFQTCFVLLRL